jgi:hypothetical protein
MKKKLLFFVALLFAVAGMWSRATAQCTPGGPVTTASTIPICEGTTTVDVPVTVTSFTNVGVISLKLLYDHTKLGTATLLSQNASLWANFTVVVHPGAAYDTIAVSGFGAGITLGAGTLFTLRFTKASAITAGTLTFYENIQGTSCEYAPDVPPDYNPFCDTPITAYYIAGGVTVDAQPVVSDEPNQVQCNTSTFTMTQTAPAVGTGLWTLVSGTATITTPSLPATTVTGVVAGTTAVVRWTVTNGTCGSVFDDVTLQNDILPVVSDQPDLTQCNTSDFTMTQSAPTVGTGLWTLVSGSATITTPALPITTVTGVVAGTTAVVRWTVTNGTCSAFDDVTLQNDVQPVVSDQPNQTQCNNSTFTMTQSAPLVGAGLWTLVSGSATITTPASPVTTVMGVLAGTSVVVRWTVTNGTCNAFDDVTLQNDVLPVVSDQPNQNQCNTSTFTMTQSAPAVGTGLWTLVSGTATITTPASPTTTVTGVVAGTTAVVRWTVTNGTCSPFDEVTLQNDVQPAVSDQPNQTQCDISTFTMTQGAPAVGTGLWTLQSGTATITTPSSPVTTVTGVVAGTTVVVRWTVTNGTCSAFDEVTLQNDVLPVVSDQPDLTQCNSSTFTMT